MRFGVAVKPRLTIPGQEQNGNFLSAWDFTGGNLNMEFSPELQENIKNGIAQIDVGSTGSGFTNSAISQRYAQLDLVRRFEIARSEEHTSELQYLMRTSYAVFFWTIKT